MLRCRVNLDYLTLVSTGSDKMEDGYFCVLAHTHKLSADDEIQYLIEAKSIEMWLTFEY